MEQVFISHILKKKCFAFVKLFNIERNYVKTRYYHSFILLSRKIDPNTSKAMKIYPLPHMYVIKDLVPVSNALVTQCDI